MSNTNTYYIYEDGRLVEKTESKKYVRVRAFACISYIPVEYLARFLKSSPWIQHWAYCVHDKDRWTELDEQHNPEHKNGTLKDKHTHVILYTYDGKTSSAVARLFERYAKQICPIGERHENTLVEICDDMLYMWRYLLHLDDPDKYQYEDIQRHCDNIDYWRQFERTAGMNCASNNTGYQMIEDLLAGTSQREMVLRYGKEYIYHHHHFRDVTARIINEQYGGCGDTVPVDADLVRLLLSNIGYNEQEIHIFIDMLAMLNRECFAEFGSRADFLVGTYLNKNTKGLNHA